MTVHDVKWHQHDGTLILMHTHCADKARTQLPAGERNWRYAPWTGTVKDDARCDFCGKPVSETRPA